MRWAVVAMLAACGTDPTLAVIVEHPMGITVSSTVVTVYESASLTCEIIEFGDLDPDQLETTAVATETISPPAPTQGAIVGISRTDPKYVVARGYGSDGKLLTAGCTEKDEVVGADSVMVTTVVAASASVSFIDPTGASDMYGLTITTTDQTGTVINGREVSWRVTGPMGTTAATMPIPLVAVGDVSQAIWQPADPVPTCTTDGVATVHPVPPNLIGGFAIQPRVAWAVAPPPLFTSLNATPVLQPLTPTGMCIIGGAACNTTTDCTGLGNTCSLPTKMCALGSSGGKAALVCLTNGGAQTYTVTVADGVTSITAAANPPVALADTIGVYALPTGTGTDLDVYSMSSAGTAMRVYPSAGTPIACTALANECGLLAPFDDLMVVPACGGTTKLLLHTNKALTADKQVKWIDTSSGALTDFPAVIPTSEMTSPNLVSVIALNAAGCVTELDGATSTEQTVIVLDMDRLVGTTVATRAHYACTATTCQTTDLPLAGTGVGFSGGTQPYLIGATVDATGVVLVSWVLATIGSTNQLLELGRQAAAAIPTRIAVGQFDSDGLLDKIWDAQSTKKTSSVLQIAYARLVGSDPLSALSLPLRTPQGVDVNVLDLLVADLNGDGFDDVVITGQSSDTSQVSGVAVVPTQVPAAIGTLPKDPTTCAP